MKTLIHTTLIIILSLIINGCGNNEQKSGQPNILIAMASDISYPHMSAYGTQWVKTPGFDRVAEDGILFRNAYTPVSSYSPSLAAFLTGMNSWQLGSAANDESNFPVSFKGFFEVLEKNGYYTGHTAKGWQSGKALDDSGNERYITGKPFNGKRTNPPSNWLSDNDYTGNFVDFLDSREEGKPFCFLFGSDEAGRRYEYGSGVKSGKSIKDIERVFGFWPDNEIVRTDMLDYAYEIEYFDSHLSGMLKILEERGELENTIVIVTASNGMPFPRVKGQVYEYSNHVPLGIMWGSGIRNKGREVQDYISFIDIAPTILESAGIKTDTSEMQKMQGKSFMNILSSAKKGYVDATRRFVLVGRERNYPGRPDDTGYPVRGIIMDGFLYLKNYRPQRWPSGNPETGYSDIESSPTKKAILDMQRNMSNTDFWKINFHFRPEEELYKISEDPDCLNNLATDPGYNPARRSLNEELYLELLQQEDPRVYNKGDQFDKYPYGKESVRDLFNRLRKGEVNKKDADWLDSSDFEDF